MQLNGEIMQFDYYVNQPQIMFYNQRTTIEI